MHKLTPLFAILVCISILSSAQADSSLAKRRAAHLRHGINLSEWFAQVYDPKGYTKEHLVGWVTADDIALIKSMGFDHVRLSVNPEPMMRHNMADHLPPEYVGYLDAGIKMILDHGLAVIIDMHPESEFKQRLVQHDESVEQFSDYWRAIARHYSSYDPDVIFFEVLNEPEFRDRYRWAGVQAKLANSIREGAPQHTIIAAGANWSDVEDLVAMTPLPDPNVIYNFHFYDPHTFTHQGATWGANYWHFESKLAYPATLEDAQKAAREGKVDIIFGVYFNDERASYLDYVRPAFMIDPVVVMVAKGKGFPFRGRQDLVGKEGRHQRRRELWFRIGRLHRAKTHRGPLKRPGGSPQGPDLGQGRLHDRRALSGLGRRREGRGQAPDRAAENAALEGRYVHRLLEEIALPRADRRVRAQGRCNARKRRHRQHAAECDQGPRRVSKMNCRRPRNRGVE